MCALSEATKGKVCYAKDFVVWTRPRGAAEHHCGGVDATKPDGERFRSVELSGMMGIGEGSGRYGWHHLVPRSNTGMNCLE
jgi:hypothetical protein